MQIMYGFLQVCPPGLHITLGIFLRLFVLLEVECHKLDVSEQMGGSVSSGPSYDKYVAALHQQTQLKDEQHSLRGGLQLLEQLLTHMLTTGGVSSTTDPLLLLSISEIQKAEERLQQIVCTYSNTLLYFTFTYVHLAN